MQDIKNSRIRKGVRSIVERLEKYYKPEKIYLFGSAARSDFSEYSDIDLLVVKETNETSIQRMWEVYRILKGKSLPADIIVLTPSELTARIRSQDPFILEIVHHGINIYERVA